eukprot:g6024.t1
MVASVSSPARTGTEKRPYNRRAWQAALLVTSVCACLAARRWVGNGGGGEWPARPGAARELRDSPRGGTAGADESDMVSWRGDGRGAGGARRRGGGGAATTPRPPATPSAASGGEFEFLRTVSSVPRKGGGGTTTGKSGGRSSTAPEKAFADKIADAVGAPPSPASERVRTSSGGSVVRRITRGAPRGKVDADSTEMVAPRSGGLEALPVSATAAAAAAARQGGAAASRRASSTGAHPQEGFGEEVLGGRGKARRSLRRDRWLRGGGARQPPGGGGQEDEEEEEDEGAVVFEQDEDDDDDDDDGAFGSAGLVAFLVCFGLLFCVMEVAKCYFLVECRRRQRWRRQRAQGHMHEGQMPIASSRVVAPEIPGAGAKDGWVEVVVHEVSLSAAKLEDGDAKIPSAHGYAVAGASHALQEAIEHARRLSPGRGYRAVFASPARPEQQRRRPQEGE